MNRYRRSIGARGELPWRVRLWIVALAIALGVAATLGLVHRSVHGLAGVSGVAVPMDAAAASTAHGLHAFGFAALFGEHDDGQCRLYDQLSHGPAALATMPVLPAFALPLAACAFFGAQAPSWPGALFDARGPPPSR